MIGVRNRFRSWGLGRCGGLFGVGLILLAMPLEAGAAGLFRTRVNVSDRGIDFRGDLLHKVVPLADLQLQDARIVDLDYEPEFQPHLKLYGAGLPWYRSGWFRLKDRETALLALDRSRQAVYIPTTRGFAILVSPEDPSAFLNALRQPGGVEREFTISARKSH